MSLTTILSETWRFIKENFIKILLGAIILSILAVLSSMFLPNLMDQSPEEAENKDQVTQMTANEEVQASQEYLLNIYEQEPAEFELFIQLEDGNVFGNSFIFDEYFTSPEVVEKMEQEAGVEYSKTLTHEAKLGLNKTSQYRGSIAGIRNTSSNIITIRVQVAESSENNLILAETLFNQILNKEIPFTEGLNITSLSEPKITENLMEEDLKLVSSPESLGKISPTKSKKRSLLLYAIAGFILGLLGVTVLLFIIQLFKNKINYAFQYSWDFSDNHFIFNIKNESEKLRHFLLAPTTFQQIIVHQSGDFVEQFAGDSLNIETTTSLPRFVKNNEKVDEIILFVESKVTDKEWYNKQYHLAEKYGSQLTIIQVIK